MGQMRWNDDFSDVVEEPDRIQGAQFGDLALQDRLARRDVQRGMFAGRIAPTRAQAHSPWTSEGEFTTLEERGIRARTHPDLVGTLSKHGIPAPADNTPWTKMGIPAFFNRDELSSAQNYVYEPRVAEIRDDPSKAENPRFPAGHEKPHIAVVPGQPHKPRGFEGIIMNGNHRVAAELDKGALFIEGKAIVADEAQRQETWNYQNERAGRKSRLTWSHTPHPPKVQLPRHR